MGYHTAGRHGLARLGGTTCDSLKSLLEPFSVPLLGNIKGKIYGSRKFKIGKQKNKGKHKKGLTPDQGIRKIKKTLKF